ncbi:MAG: carboxymuconolactone decarboxylase family protein [Euryarchaeota archaeon]|nr:carboxymuconolactone decarboxylase family protein [Euryarchaeota archaeon]|tara:strand:- start:9186 stop:9545 length:360 start_codon:yes stop_codon:yes gene_type:complete
MSNLEKFRKFREEMKHQILHDGNLDTKRFFGLDRSVYEDGKLDKKTKEMMGLVASLVLRCDDCITYHIMQCYELGLSRDQFVELFNVAMVAGGSICVPHIRRATETLNELHEEKNSAPG